MKKYIISFLVALILLVGPGLSFHQARAADMSTKDFINLLIAIGVITPDKIPAVNAFLAALDNPTVITPTLTVTSPNGGETITQGQTYNISWNSSGFKASDLLYVYLSDGSINCPKDIVGCWGSFAIGDGKITNTGNYTWDTNEKMFGDGGPNTMSVYSGSTFKITICSAVTNVCDSSDAYFKIVSPSPTQSVTVSRPNGGEVWTQGTTQTINWRDLIPVPNCYFDGQTTTCPNYVSPRYDIKLLSYQPPCQTGYACPMIMIAPYTIAKSVYGSSYEWVVGSIGPASSVANGAYTIQICEAGTTNCDFSDSYFKIISAPLPVNNQPPVITSLTAPTSLNVGSTGTWSVQAYDPESGSLSYYVDWGDNPVYANMVSSQAVPPLQTSTFTHSYSSSGTYQVTVYVKDNAGLSAQTSATVSVYRLSYNANMVQ